MIHQLSHCSDREMYLRPLAWVSDSSPLAHDSRGDFECDRRQPATKTGSPQTVDTIRLQHNGVNTAPSTYRRRRSISLVVGHRDHLPLATHYTSQYVRLVPSPPRWPFPWTTGAKRVARCRGTLRPLSEGVQYGTGLATTSTDV